MISTNALYKKHKWTSRGWINSEVREKRKQLGKTGMAYEVKSYQKL